VARYVILGASAAGLAALEAIRERDPDGEIVMVSKEPPPCYSRVALPYLLAGEKNLGQITLRADDYFRAKRVETIWGKGAVALDAQARQVRLEDGQNLPYDKLLIATGSRPRIPPIQGIEEADVCYHWTLADARKIEEKAQKARDCFVIGAGFISLLTINALVKRSSLKFTVVEVAGRVMPQLLDQGGASLLEEVMRRQGIELLLNDTAASVERRGDGRYSIRLSSGRTYEADIVICGTGVEPNIEFLRGSNLDIGRGIRTSERQETNLPGVYAAGDCAETRDFQTGAPVIHAIWPTAVEQGQVAGANMAGDNLSYPGSLSWNVTELFGLTCASIGEFQERPGLEPIVMEDRAVGLYRKILLDSEGKAAGVVLVGRPSDAQELGVLQAAIRRGTKLARWKDHLAHDRAAFGLIAFDALRAGLAKR